MHYICACILLLCSCIACICLTCFCLYADRTRDRLTQPWGRFGPCAPGIMGRHAPDLAFPALASARTRRGPRKLPVKPIPTWSNDSCSGAGFSTCWCDRVLGMLRVWGMNRNGISLKETIGDSLQGAFPLSLLRTCKSKVHPKSEC